MTANWPTRSSASPSASTSRVTASSASTMESRPSRKPLPNTSPNLHSQPPYLRLELRHSVSRSHPRPHPHPGRLHAHLARLRRSFHDDPHHRRHCKSAVGCGRPATPLQRGLLSFAVSDRAQRPSPGQLPAQQPLPRLTSIRQLRTENSEPTTLPAA